MASLAGLSGLPSSPGGGGRTDEDWLSKFHSGDADVLAGCYRESFPVMERAVGEVVGHADRESIIHEIFSRLLGDPAFRQAFRGGSFSAWIGVVARHQAIDYARRLKRETFLGDRSDDSPHLRNENRATEARILVEAFRRNWLTPAWESVFDACFLGQMSQREAAQALGLSRTTVAYRELRIRGQLRQFLRDEEFP
jgi:RNA polymerase sigma-70 factor (ECF subfamily)